MGAIMHFPHSVSLPARLSHSLDEITKETHISRGALIASALEEYLFKFRFNKLRERMVLKARAKGVFTDDDLDRRLT